MKTRLALALRRMANRLDPPPPPPPMPKGSYYISGSALPFYWTRSNTAGVPVERTKR